MPGEFTAFLSAFCYAMSYVALNRAQAQGRTCDNGLLPVLWINGLMLAAAVAWKLWVQGVQWVPLGPRAVAYGALSGVCGMFFGRAALYACIARIGATRGVVVKSLAPFLTLVLAVLFLGERPELLHAVGFVILICSIALLVLEHVWLNHDRSFWKSQVTIGFFLGACAAVCQGAEHVLRKLALNAVGVPLFPAAVEAVTAASAYLIFLAFTGRLRAYCSFYLRNRSADVLVAGLLCTCGVLLFFEAITRASVSAVAVIVGLQPVLVAIVSRVFFPGLERFTWITYLYSVCVVAGVCVLAGLW